MNQKQILLVLLECTLKFPSVNITCEKFTYLGLLFMKTSA